MTPDEIALVGRARRGEIQAQRLLFERYHRIVFATALVKVGNREDASDIAQDVFLRVFRGLADLKKDAAFAPWLRTITDNRCRTFYERDRAKAPRHADITEHEDRHPKADSPDGLLSGREDAQKALQAVRALPESYRDPLLMRYLDGLSSAQIAERVGTTPGAARVLLYRALTALRERLGVAARDESAGGPS